MRLSERGSDPVLVDYQEETTLEQAARIDRVALPSGACSPEESDSPSQCMGRDAVTPLALRLPPLTLYTLKGSVSMHTRDLIHALR